MAGKRKNSDDNWLPPRVYRGRSAYEYRPDRKKVIRLCGFEFSKSEVWTAYEEIIDKTFKEKTFAALCEEFINSLQFSEYAYETRDKYLSRMEVVKKVFGQMHVAKIQPKHIRKYMDLRGVKAKVEVNREKSLMSTVFAWGYERGMVPLNPCNGVKNFKERSRTRYITDDEYNALYSVATNVERVAMEISYLCIARQKDVLSMRKTQLIESGIIIKQSKTEVKQIKAWSDRLKAVIALAETLPLKGVTSSEFVIHKTNGGRYTRSGFNDRWKQAKRNAAIAFPDLDFNFTFHDLKAKGMSDLEGEINEKKRISGHKSVRNAQIYDRKIPIVPVVGNQKKKKKKKTI